MGDMKYWGPSRETYIVQKSICLLWMILTVGQLGWTHTFLQGWHSIEFGLCKKYFGAIFADTIIFLSYLFYGLDLRMSKSLSKDIFLFIVIVREPMKHKCSEHTLRIEVNKLIKSW